MEKLKILIVEDALDLAKVVQKALEEEGFSATIAGSGQKAIALLDDYWNLLILDLMLPDFSGEKILEYVRSSAHSPPVLITTARNRLEDKLGLFRKGCDDYLTKPFDIEELLERVHALLRRGASRPASTQYSYEDLKLDPATYRLATEDKAINLTPKESAICQALMRQPGQVVSRQELLLSAWGLNHEPQTNFLGVHLLNLRKKLSQLDRADWLQTVRSSGVMLQRPGNELTT